MGPKWKGPGGGNQGEATRRRHPGGLKHDCDGESTGKVNPDLGLKMEAKARTDMWTVSKYAN